MFRAILIPGPNEVSMRAATGEVLHNAASGPIKGPNGMEQDKTTSLINIVIMSGMVPPISMGLVYAKKTRNRKHSLTVIQHAINKADEFIRGEVYDWEQ